MKRSLVLMIALMFDTAVIAFLASLIARALR